MQISYFGVWVFSNLHSRLKLSYLQTYRSDSTRVIASYIKWRAEHKLARAEFCKYLSEF